MNKRLPRVKRKRLPRVKLFLGKTIDGYPKHVIQEHVNSGHNGHVFLAFDASTESKLAFKIVPFDNLPKGKDGQLIHLNEPRKANVLKHSSVVQCHNVVPYHDTQTSKSYMVFVCDFVDGKNLREYMKQHQTAIDVPFVENFLRTMLELLFELKKREFQHGDLHAGNVLVAKSEFDVYGRTTFHVTDFNVREFTGHVAHAKDYLDVAKILRELLECVDYRKCEGRDRHVYNVLRNDVLARHLYDTDTSADPLTCNPSGLLAKLDSLDGQYSDANQGSGATLVTPFDYPNCEQIGNSHLLLKNLYSDRLLGLSEIQARSNLMLTGPRGCGKTTVFRALSLEYLISTNNDKPDDINYIGIYYRCDDLYFSFPRYNIPARVEALDIPMHFLITTLLATALEQIGAWAKRHFSKEFEKKEESLVVELLGLFEWSTPDSPSARQLATLVNRLKSEERRRAAQEQRFVSVSTEPVSGYFCPGRMFQACQLIQNKFSFLRNRPFYFFIDDYSHPKITKELQSNLNRLLMHRRPDVFFKISTESPVSFAQEDVDGKQFVETREYELLNLGLRYIMDESKQTLGFLEDLFSRRFREVENYPVQTLDQLLGSMPRNENATARAFRKKKGQENYAGKETIAAMCSGDIHYMIRLVARMVDNFGDHAALAESEKVPRIPPREQHKSIRAAAGDFMESVRTLPRWGGRLAEVMTAFGNVAHSYLLYETSTNEASKPPHQASRIEPYEPLQLSDEAQEVLDELLRYSILLKDPRGKSRRENVVPRFYLRRYLIPHFRLTFSRRDSLQLENHQIETLLCKPKNFEKSRKSRSKDGAARRHRRNPNQEGLFP